MLHLKAKVGFVGFIESVPGVHLSIKIGLTIWFDIPSSDLSTYLARNISATSRCLTVITSISRGREKGGEDMLVASGWATRSF